MLIAIDPGLTGTGWAAWRHVQKPYVPTRVGVIELPSKANVLPFEQRAYLISLTVKSEIRRIDRIEASDDVYIELPMQMQSRSGLAAQKGAVYKLAFTAGMIGGHLSPASIITVQPTRWKGQLPKSVVSERIVRYLTKEVVDRLGIKTHAFDAVGIGLWAIRGQV